MERLSQSPNILKEGCVMRLTLLLSIVLCVIGFIAFSAYSINIFLSGAGRAPVPFEISLDLKLYNVLLDQIEKVSPKDKKLETKKSYTLPRIDPEQPDRIMFLVDIDGDRSAKLMLEKQKLFLKKVLCRIVTYTAIFAAALAPIMLFSHWVDKNFIKDKTAQIIEKNTEVSKNLRTEAEGILKQAERVREETLMEKQAYISKRQALEADLNETYEKMLINVQRKNKEDLKQQDAKYKKALQEKNKQIDELKNKIGAIRALSEKW